MNATYDVVSSSEQRHWAAIETRYVVDQHFLGRRTAIERFAGLESRLRSRDICDGLALDGFPDAIGIAP